MAPVSQWGPRLPFKARSTCGSHSGSYGSLGTQNAYKDIDLPVVHTAAPAAHWGPRTHKKKRRDLYDVDVKWLPGLTEDPYDRNYLDLQVVHGVALRAQWGSRRSTMAEPTCHLCKIYIVAPAAHWGHGTLKITRCTWRWYAVAPARGSLGMQKEWERLDKPLFHILAPTAHWGPKQSGNG